MLLSQLLSPLSPGLRSGEGGSRGWGLVEAPGRFLEGNIPQEQPTSMPVPGRDSLPS